MSVVVDDQVWASLHEAAVAAAGAAYAPYSNYPVGVAAVLDDGRICSGCNVENASYGVGLCAECGLVSQVAASGGGPLRAVWCVNGRGETIMPCGRCRQLLFEFGGPECQIMTPQGVLTLAEILPQAFGPADLDAIR